MKSTQPTARTCVLAAALLFLTARAIAQTPISGAQSGVLPAGVYHATNSLTVALGQTWTLNAGVIIKFTGAFEVSVAGTLNVNGSSGNPVIFTGIQDDSAGGDTNGNGPSTAGPTAWRGIVFNGGGGNLTYADVRYGGSGFVSNVELNSASPTLLNCTIRNCFTHGVDLNGNSTPAVTGCTIQDNGGYAIHGAVLGGTGAVLNNSATGNAVNSVLVTNAALTANTTIGAASNLTGGILFGTSIGVPAGVTLTLGAGTNLKFTGPYEVNVAGTLFVNGAAGNPVVFTGAQDDSAGGDTNTNGASTAGATAWRGIVFTAGSNASVLNYADIRYGGASFISNVELNSASPTFTSCVIRNCHTHGMDLNANSSPTVTGCTFTANGGYAIEQAHVGAVSSMTGNVAAGNAVNSVHVTAATLSSDVTIGPASNLSGGILVATSIVVPSPRTLTLNAGTVLKMENGGVEVNVTGTLLVNGTIGNPVVFTGAQDDSAGGDTNSNGVSSAGPTAWLGLVFGAGSDASVLTGADIRYGGASYVSNVELSLANPTFRNCIIRNCFTRGMDLNANSSPVVENCVFTSNGDVAVGQVAIAAVPGFKNNSASGNGGNYLQVVNGSVASALTIPAHAILNGALRMSTGIAVQAGATLTVDQGVVFKFDGGHEVVVDGALNLRGTSYEPVVFTAFADDLWGGDTNNNGPSAGGAAAWRGVTLTAVAAASTLRNVVIRFPGESWIAGLASSSPNVALRSVRVEHAFDRGLVLGALASNPTNLVARGCGSYAIHLTGGTFDVLHATSTANSIGVRAEPAWTGVVRNSIAWGNGVNFSNVPSAQVSHSNGGFAGINNNANVDPDFVDAASGDLRLQATSPCIDVAEILVAFAATEDHAENSRILDSDFDGVPGADMGAFEHAPWDMAVTGTTRIGTTMSFTVTGPGGDSTYLLGILDGTIPISPYGILLSGAIPYVTVIPLIPTAVPVGVPLVVTVPNDPGIVGLVAALQTLTVPTSDPSAGNFTRLYRARVRP